jgi:hypothetical protein
MPQKSVQSEQSCSMRNLIVAFRIFSKAPKNAFGGTLTSQILQVTPNTARFITKKCYMLPIEWICVFWMVLKTPIISP